MFRNVLVSVDDSQHAQQALTEAIDLASRTGARLTILTAVPPPPAWAFSTPGAGAAGELVGEFEREFEKINSDAAARVPDTIAVTRIVTREPIQKALLARIVAGHHDLVMMGSRGRGGMRSALLGSVSHFVLHHSPVPVLIVHADTSAGGDAVGAGAAVSTEGSLHAIDGPPGGAALRAH
jgi:nucleotide-binding universal stress UspA family protein